MRKRKTLHKHTVIKVQEIAPNYYILDFERQFNFEPGQVVAVGINENDNARLYSIASGNQQPYMRILFDVYPKGYLTPQLHRLKKGDDLYISEPFGKFVSSDKNEWWIATGTGIAPFLSMLDSGIKKPLKVLHGARTLEQFLFSDFLNNQLANNYMRFCTSESHPDVIDGRLTEWIKSQNTLHKDIKYYLCGHPEMVVNVRDLLIEKGIDFDQIMAEIYF